jgi:hypothetical protein
MFLFGRGKAVTVLTELQKDILARVEGDLKGIRSVVDLAAKVKSLREEKEKLEIEAARRDETFARKEREIEHKVGLERKRQEFELASGKREATLSVREENLAADRKRFEEQMAFHEKRFTEEVSYLKQIIGDIAERLPTANFTGNLTARKGK